MMTQMTEELPYQLSHWEERKVKNSTHRIIYDATNFEIQVVRKLVTLRYSKVKGRRSQGKSVECS